MSQLVQQEQQEQEQREGVERRQQTQFSTRIMERDDAALTVELLRRDMTATGTLTVEDGTEQKHIDITEEEAVATFTVLLADARYAHLVPDVWDILAERLDVDPVTVRQLPLPTALRSEDMDAGELPAIDLPAVQQLAEPVRSFPTRKTVSYTVEASVQVYQQESDDSAYDAPVLVDAPRIRTDVELDADIAGMPVPRPVQQDAVVAYSVGAEQEGQTVMDSLLDQVEQGELTATLVRQPYYSPHRFEKDGVVQDAGWQEDYWFVQLEDFDVRKTEFSYNGTLAMDGIDAVTVSDGDYLSFEESEEYTCGAYTPSDEMRDAWEHTYRWFDDDLARGVYAAMVEGNEFLGASFDLHAAGLDEVRDAYLDEFGVAPEQVFDNVTYLPV